MFNQRNTQTAAQAANIGGGGVNVTFLNAIVQAISQVAANVFA